MACTNNTNYQIEARKQAWQERKAASAAAAAAKQKKQQAASTVSKAPR